jgi:hypothetical protein
MMEGSMALERRGSLRPSRTPETTRRRFMAERKRSTRTYSKRRSRADWRPGRSEADSEKRSWRVGASSGRASSGMTKGLGEGHGEGVEHAGAEFDGGADELGALFL